MNVEIFIELLQEGTQVWRPVKAKKVDEDLYLISPTEIPEGELWRFTPGSTVRCEYRKFSDGKNGLVAVGR